MILFRKLSHIKDSFQLVDKLKGIYFNDNYKLIFLDMVLLFTNIPIDLAVDCINDNWTYN